MLMHAQQQQQSMAMQFPLGLHLGGEYPHAQHHAAAGRVSYDTHEEDEHGGHNGRGIGGSALLGRKHAPDRRPLRFWQPFNGAHSGQLGLVAARLPCKFDCGSGRQPAAETCRAVAGSLVWCFVCGAGHAVVGVFSALLHMCVVVKATSLHNCHTLHWGHCLLADWWRSELERTGRRPTSQEIGDW